MPMKPRVFGQNDKHKRESRQAYDRQRGTVQPWRKWYCLKRWEKAKEVHFAKNPLCVECEKSGRIEPFTDLDHIVPHRGDYDLFWDPNNWQGLCKSHHSQKTRRGE